MSDQPSMTQDVGVALAKAFPPVTIWALTLNEWLAIASIVYIIAQLAYLIWKWVREAKRRKPSAPAA